MQFLDFDIFSSSNFAENMNVSLPILPYFKGILENAWSLQNFGDYIVEGLRQELCALNAEKCIQKLINYQISIVPFFHLSKWEKMLT